MAHANLILNESSLKEHTNMMDDAYYALGSRTPVELPLLHTRCKNQRVNGCQFFNHFKDCIHEIGNQLYDCGVFQVTVFSPHTFVHLIALGSSTAAVMFKFADTIAICRLTKS